MAVSYGCEIVPKDTIAQCLALTEHGCAALRVGAAHARFLALRHGIRCLLDRISQSASALTISSRTSAKRAFSNLDAGRAAAVTASSKDH